jgi:hypothetical protein
MLTGSSGSTVNDPPPPPTGAFSLTLAPPLASEVSNLGTRVGCNAGTVGTFTYAIGDPSQAQTIEDGFQGVNVSCQVIPAESGANDVQVAIGGTEMHEQRPVSVSVSSHVSMTQPVSASLTFFSPDTLHLTTLVGFPSCTLGPTLTVGDGAFHADISCPLIGDPADDSSGCRAQGTFVVTDCSRQ